MHDIIFDNSFEVEKTEDYILSIQVGLDGFSFSVVNPTGNRLLALNSNSLKISDEKFLSRRFNEWVESEKLLNSRFGRTNIIFDTEKFTIVPEEYYAHNPKAEIFNLLFEITERSSIEENIPENINARLLFLLPESLKKGIAAHFEEFYLVHPLESLFSNIPESDKKFRMLLYFREKFFYTVLFENEKLLLANSFNFGHENDTVFYILSVIKHLNIKGKATELFVAGKQHPGSFVLTELRKYVAATSILSLKQPVQFNEELFPLAGSLHFLLLNKMQ